ncbi:transcriptional regulator [Robiginitalea sp. SC105]|uniref:winged helix-turn-helix domain-containing protein n=1 Tax=Robiginitalea sp. SC105 TaxID=2762332 RepID=UPI00163A28B9|nr:transcriptional regulator [Robiginitalea sp. SC105]MBC2839735.1 transcriptional regulator [Robiginitalea sp. SC105]
MGLIDGIDKVFDHRIRLGIMSVLMVNDHMDFTGLRELLGVTDGNLASHIRALETAHYLQVEKKFINRKPNTRYAATETGKEAFGKHLTALEKLLGGQADIRGYSPRPHNPANTHTGR